MLSLIEITIIQLFIIALVPALIAGGVSILTVHYQYKSVKHNSDMLYEKHIREKKLDSVSLYMYPMMIELKDLLMVYDDISNYNEFTTNIVNRKLNKKEQDIYDEILRKMEIIVDMVRKRASVYIGDKYLTNSLMQLIDYYYWLKRPTNVNRLCSDIDIRRMIKYIKREIRSHDMIGIINADIIK